MLARRQARAARPRCCAIFDKWDLDAAVIGRVTDTGKIVRAATAARSCADIPVAPLAEGLQLRAPVRAPGRRSTRAQRSTSASLPAPADLGAALLDAAGVAEHRVQGVGLPPVRSHGARRHRGAPRRRRRGRAHPRRRDGSGARQGPRAHHRLQLRASARSTRTRARAWPSPRRTATSSASAPSRSASPTASTSATPSGPRSCGSSSRPSAASATPAARSTTPIVSGNVSLYNETDGARDPADADASAWSGSCRRVADAVGAGASTDGRLRDRAPRRQHRRDRRLGVPRASSTASSAGAPPAARPRARARRRQRLPRAGARAACSPSAHDCSEGGLAVALAECCVTGEPARSAPPSSSTTRMRADLLLFGEAPSRIVVSLRARARSGGARDCRAATARRSTVIGATGGRRLNILSPAGRLMEAPVETLAAAWKGGFRKLVS